MNCKFCGAELQPEAIFCAECGHRIVAEQKCCPACGGTVKEGQHFCQICGRKLDEAPLQVSNSEDNISAYRDWENMIAVSPGAWKLF